MKKSITITLIVVLILTSIVFISSCLKKENVIKIGAIFPLTGNAGRIGEMKKEGADLAVDEINSEGGVNRKKIEMIYEDSENDAKKGTAAFEKLIQLYKVPIVMSAMSGVSYPLAHIADRNEIILFANVGHPTITHFSKWVFRNFPTTEQEARVMAEYAKKELGIDRIAILSVNDEWGKTGSNSFKEHFDNMGGKILIQEEYDKQDTDFRVQLTKIKSIKPQAIFVTGFGNALGLITKQYKELNIKGYFLTTTGFNDPEIIKIAGSGAEGVIFTTSAFNIDSEEKIVKDFVESFQKKYNKKPGFDEALQYDTVKLIVIAMKNHGFSSDGIRKGLDEIHEYHGVCGLTKVNEEGDFETPIIIRTIKNNKVVNL